MDFCPYFYHFSSLTACDCFLCPGHVQFCFRSGKIRRCYNPNCQRYQRTSEACAEGILAGISIFYNLVPRISHLPALYERERKQGSQDERPWELGCILFKFIDFYSFVVFLACFFVTRNVFFILLVPSDSRRCFQSNI